MILRVKVIKSIHWLLFYLKMYDIKGTIVGIVGSKTI